MQENSLGNLLVQETEYGPIYYEDSTDPVIAYLKKGVLYGEQNFKFLDQFILSDGTILDCGAHIGTFALPASKKYDVVAIEGAQSNFRCLQETFKSSTRVSVKNAILSDSENSPCDFDENGPFGFKTDSLSGNRLTSTIDSVSCDIQNVCAIKLDVEGSEIEALEGAEKTLNKYKPPILTEINGHCLNFSLKTPQDLIRKIYSLDYVPYIVFYGQFVKLDPDRKFPFCVIDAICIHKDKLAHYISLKDRQFTDEEINMIFSMNWKNSNEDCKKYFERCK